MLLDEGGGIEPAMGVLTISRADERRFEFAHFEVKMREVTAIGGPDGGDFFASLHRLARLNEDGLDVGVIGLHIGPHSLLKIGMQNNDHVAPAGAAFPSEEDPPVRDRVNGISQITIFPANAIEVVAQMTVRGKRLGIVSKSTMLAA